MRTRKQAHVVCAMKYTTEHYFVHNFGVRFTTLTFGLRDGGSKLRQNAIVF